ncbi:MAG: hypothetical protein AAF798_18390, partial [Bacteroidota bacterium]
MRKALIVFIGLSFSLAHFSCQNANVEQGIQSPRVTAVFPSADTLPENLLRMYIQFSKPMKPIGNLEKIKLVDEQGQEIVGAIFDNVHELWDREQLQLTLILDPARVKTGLQANAQMGRALQAGKEYKLVVGQLEDVEGVAMDKGYTKAFHVSATDRLTPNKEAWFLSVPEAGSRTPFVVEFPQMLDRLSLLQRLIVTDKMNQPIVGAVRIGAEEKSWQFIPKEEWAEGEYILYINTRLEDPC